MVQNIDNTQLETAIISLTCDSAAESTHLLMQYKIIYFYKSVIVRAYISPQPFKRD